MAEDDQLLRRPSSQIFSSKGGAYVVLALQTTTLDINTNVEARLKIMYGSCWHLVEDGYLGIEKHCRKWIPFVHAKVVLPSQFSSMDRNLGKLVREIG